MISKKFKLASIMCIMFFGAAFVFTSCGDDDDDDDEVVIQGCTDMAANNFNDLAAEDDGSCTFDREAFFGDYLSTLNCPTSPTLELINTDSLTFSIAESLDVDAKDDVLITFTSTALLGISFRAVVDGNNLNIPETTLEDLPLEVLGTTINADITASGDFDLTDDEIVGVINIDAVQDNGAALGMDMCDLAAVRQ